VFACLIIARETGHERRRLKDQHDPALDQMRRSEVR
jgi:hypothetical protein